LIVRVDEVVLVLISLAVRVRLFSRRGGVEAGVGKGFGCGIS
jgi:hypothetical protein